MCRAHRGRLRRLTALLAAGLLLAACSSTTSSDTSSTLDGPASAHGTASVACAGSLLKLYKDALGPAFAKATGDGFGGPLCAGSLALASEIRSGEIAPGAFVSVGAAAIKELFPSWAKFVLAFASDPLVVAYSPHSRYYAQLNAIRSGKEPLSDLFRLFMTPGFRLGRTDPTQDPQGTFFILMSKLAQTQLHLPPGEAAKALGVTPSSPYGAKSQIFDEDALPTDIASGLVDAGSEYLPEAKQYGLDYISLPPDLDFGSPSDLAAYATVSLPVNGVVQKGELITLDVGLVSPKDATTSIADEAADESFVAFLLSPAGRAVLRSAGYRLIRPVLQLAPGVSDAAAVVPTAILSRYRSLGGTVSTS